MFLSRMKLTSMGLLFLNLTKKKDIIPIPGAKGSKCNSLIMAWKEMHVYKYANIKF
jgi:hypothetical protein